MPLLQPASEGTETASVLSEGQETLAAIALASETLEALAELVRVTSAMYPSAAASFPSARTFPARRDVFGADLLYTLGEESQTLAPLAED